MTEELADEEQEQKRIEKEYGDDIDDEVCLDKWQTIVILTMRTSTITKGFCHLPLDKSKILLMLFWMVQIEPKKIIDVDM